MNRVLSVAFSHHQMAVGYRDGMLKLFELGTWREFARVRAHQAFLIALDEHGKMMNSPQFAQLIQQKKEMEGQDLAFIIGGPYGLSPEVLQKANLKLSFSAFTFTHEMIRMLVLEQLYRVFTIMTGKTYHSYNQN